MFCRALPGLKKVPGTLLGTAAAHAIGSFRARYALVFLFVTVVDAAGVADTVGVCGAVNTPLPIGTRPRAIFADPIVNTIAR